MEKMQQKKQIPFSLRLAHFAARATPSIVQVIGDCTAIILALPVFILLGFFTGLYTISIPLHNTTMLGTVLMSITPLSLAYWLFVFWLAGLYRNWFVRSPFDEMFTIIRAVIFGSLSVFLAILFSSYNLQGLRFKILLYAALLTVLLVLSRLAGRVFQRALRRRRIINIRTILLGTPARILEMYQTMIYNPAWGYSAQGIILRQQGDEQEWTNISAAEPAVPILGYSADAHAILSRERPSDLIITMEETDHRWLLDIVMHCRELGMGVKIMPDLYEIFTGQARLLAIYGMPLIDINPELLKTWEQVVKRIFDVAFSATVLVLAFPFLVLTAILVKLDSRGPVFFSQERVGKNGRRFIIYKFRSMFTDAEKGGPKWATVNDPRVTRFGRFLRKSHLDELPQFWNVLKGEMSLVGPRPERPYFVEKFSREVPHYMRRLVVRPGITGWNQIHYRDYEESLQEITNRLKDDFYYIENMSLQLDVEIIMRTVIRVFKGQGQA
jgi:exopolysaccharide biosynthesis polyprenyl glycosylphosphotransferase